MSVKSVYGVCHFMFLLMTVGKRWYFMKFLRIQYRCVWNRAKACLKENYKMAGVFSFNKLYL